MKRITQWNCVSSLIATIVVGSMLAGAASADLVLGDIFPAKQPDGTEIQVRIWGDEFYSRVESLDGYTLVRDPATGFLCYAAVSADGSELVSTGTICGQQTVAAAALPPKGIRLSTAARTAIAAAKRADFKARMWGVEGAPPAPTPATLEGGGAQATADGPLAAPTTGNVLGLTILIDFSDDVATIPRANVEAYCNDVGYGGYSNAGSVRDYFYDVSNGDLTYTNQVTEYYRAQHPKSYYNDTSISFGTRARELVLEALNYLDGQGMDFSQFDADNDNRVDALNIFYAGYRNVGWSEGLWPHAWTVYFSADGVSTSRYQMTDMQSSLRLSTFCHENGHMLMGWPDLYDYGYESTGVGRFCIMCYSSSSTNPQEPCAYMKADAGWANVTTVTGSIINASLTFASNDVFKVPHPTRSYEYFLIENRQKSGRDVDIPDSGLAIWHCDETGNNDYEQMTYSQHYEVSLEQADGDFDMENDRNSGDSTDLYAAPTYTSFTPSTTPDSSWWGGADSTLRVTNISAAGTTMTFDIWVGDDCNNNGTPDGDDISGGTSLDCNGNGIPDECDVSSGGSNDCNGNGVPDECETDCNNNGLADECEIADQTVPDCNNNGVPDSCDIAAGTSEDCDDNGVPDSCDIAAGALDCNGNGVPDDCDIASGTSLDCNANGIPDACDLASGFADDCNSNRAPDDCDIDDGTSPDCNLNGAPDECDVASATSPDCNANGTPDECDVVRPVPYLTDALPARSGWINFSSFGTPLNLGGDDIATVTLPFANELFPETVQIANDGAVGFDAPATLAPENAPLPAATAFGGGQALCAYWDDLGDETGDVYYGSFFPSPNRIFIVQWDDRPHATATPGSFGDEFTFALQIFETPINNVYAQVLYDDVWVGDELLSYGGSATIGYQDGDGAASEWSYNEAVLDPTPVLSLVWPDAYSVDDNGNDVPDECETYTVGDLNCDGFVDTYDIDAFVMAINGDGSVYAAAFPTCDRMLADCNNDGFVDTYDIDAFVALISGQ